MPEMTLRASGVVPPILLSGESLMSMPVSVLPRSTSPVASVPMKFPSMTFPPGEDTLIPIRNWLITSPRTVLLPA